MPSKTKAMRYCSGTRHVAFFIRDDVVTSVAMQCMHSRQTGGRQHRKLQLLDGLHGTQQNLCLNWPLGHIHKAPKTKTDVTGNLWQLNFNKTRK